MGNSHRFPLALTIIGALNWGVARIFRFDVVAQHAGGATQPLDRFIYLIIGILGIFNLRLLFDHQQNPYDVKMTAVKEA